MTGFVLCAGLGTRLRPLTNLLPKPAVPVCGVPLVGYAFAALARAGVDRLVVNTHHLPAELARVAGEAAKAVGLPLSVSGEPVIAGTGGALREARALLAGAGEILLWNGDVLFDLDVAAAVAAHRASGALATMVLMPMPPGASYAPVEIDAERKVRLIAGKFGPGGEALTPWHFTGVHVLSAALLDRVPAEPFECDVNRHVYPPLMAGGLVHAHLVDGTYWNDLGTPARYLAANLDVLEGRMSVAHLHALDPFAGHAPFGEPGVLLGARAHVEPRAALHAPCLVGPGARVEAGATVGPRAVVGAGALVAAGAAVRDAVVWPGTELGAGEAVVKAIAAGSERVRA